MRIARRESIRRRDGLGRLALGRRRRGPSRRTRSASLRCSRVGAVEDQDAVEVVHLVLDHARLETRGLDQDRLAVLVARVHAHVDRPLDVDAPRRAG